MSSVSPTTSIASRCHHLAVLADEVEDLGLLRDAVVQALSNLELEVLVAGLEGVSNGEEDDGLEGDARGVKLSDSLGGER